MGWSEANIAFFICCVASFAIGAVISPLVIWLYIIRRILRASWIDTIEITGEAIKSYAQKKRS